MTTKTCTACNVDKPVEDFYRKLDPSRGKRYVMGRCKACFRTRHQSYPCYEQAKRRGNAKKQAWKTSLRGPACEACGSAVRLVVDHDHEGPCGHNGKSYCRKCVRGTLCNDCNLALGHLKDSPDRIIALAAYLLSKQDVLGEIEVADPV